MYQCAKPLTNFVLFYLGGQHFNSTRIIAAESDHGVRHLAYQEQQVQKGQQGRILRTQAKIRIPFPEQNSYGGAVQVSML